MNYDLDQDRGIFAALCAKLDLSIGATDKLTSQLAKPRKRQPPAQPVFGRVRASGFASSAGFVVLKFDQAGPKQGYFWYIRSIVVGGLSPTTTAAGRADVYVVAGGTPQGSSLASLGLSDWRDQSATLPNVAFYGVGEMPLRHNEDLYIIISNGTGDQQYVAAAQFEQYEEAASRQEWAL